MKSFRKLSKVIATGAVALLLLTVFCGCAVSAGDTDLRVAAAPTDTRAVRSFAGAGNIGAKRLSGIRPIERPTAAAPAKVQVINVLDMQGTVTVVSGGTEMPAYAGMRLSAGDKLTTGDNSSATLDLNNGGMVLVEENSALEITQTKADYIEVSLLNGNIVNNIEKGNGKFGVKANNVTMGVLGTVFRVKLSDGIARVDLYEGSVSVTLVGSGGEEHSFVLGEGMSFEGTDDTINDSIEEGALETGELDLTELPDAALDWITQSLEEREPIADDAEKLGELIDALRREIDRRRRDDTPAAPPAPPAPTPPPVSPSPTPAPPSLVWGDASMSGTGTAGAEEYTLTMSWRVENSTTPWDCGIHWSYAGWNTTEVPENKSSFFTYNGVRYYLSEYVGWGTGNFNVSAYDLKAAFQTGDTTIDSATLDVILIPDEFDRDAAHVFDHATVVVNDRTPNIAVSETAGGATVTVAPTTDEIEDYRNVGADPEVVIPVDQPSTPVTDAEAETIAEKTVYPEGDTSGKAIDSVDGDTAIIDVYLPTEVDAGPGES